MDMVTISRAELEQRLEDRVRSFVDEGTIAPGTMRHPPNRLPQTTDRQRPRGPAGTWRGTLSPFTQAFRPDMTDDDAAQVLRYFRGVFHEDSSVQRSALSKLGGSSVVARASQTVSEEEAGGIFVPEQFVNEVIIELPKFTPFADASLIRIVPMASDTMKWPKVTTKPAAPTVIPEEGTYSKTRALFGFVELIARKIGEIIPMTEEMLEGSNIEMVALLAELVGEQLADKRNALVTNGTGASEPEGIRQNSAVGTKAWDATDDVTKADSIIAIFHAVKSAYRGDAIWLIHDTRIELIRKLKDGDKRYLWTDGFAEAPASILGRPVFENPDIPTDLGGGTDESEILWGNFRRGYVLGTRRGLFVDRNSSGEDWEKDIVNFKFRERYDGKVTDAAALIRGTGVK